jgi:hypothetical protein
MNKAAVHESIDRLEELTRHFGGPYADYHREFKQLLFKLNGCRTQAPYFREQLSKLQQYADIGFSTRKFEKVTGGLNQLRVWTLGTLQTVSDLADQQLPD